MKDFFRENKPLHFVFPIDGDCLNAYDGVVTKDGLEIMAKVSAMPGKSIKINGRAAEFDGQNYILPVTLNRSRGGLEKTVLTASDGEGESDSITVYDVIKTQGGYRISSDDNILFLRDINDNRDTYKSIFENPYLSVYKRAHDLYGAKVHLNLFYETDDMHTFNEKGQYFNLSMMTDKFKSEFESNSDWLRLSFHARSEFPECPYEHTSAQRIKEDAQLINRQIIRFAGKKTLAHVTTVHFGTATREGTVALRGLGYASLAGYFEHTAGGNPLVAYYYPDRLIDHVGGRDFWVNTEDDIIHARIDLVLNSVKYAKLLPELEKIRSCPHRAGFLELMIHEQYFYPQYSNYIPEFEALVVDSAKWAVQNGYSGMFFSDRLL